MNPCFSCEAKCCRYVTVTLDGIDDPEDRDEIRWFLLHDNVKVYLDHEADWVVEFNTPCKFLKDNQCTYYNERPEICREHDPQSCEHYGDDESWKLCFTSVKEFDEWLEKVKGKSSS